MKLTILILFLFVSLSANSLTIPKNNKASFDIIRKNKIIGSAKISFIKNNEFLTINSVVNIKVRLLFIPAYKFYQNSTEIWKNDNFIEFKGHTDFEDEREYFIKGKDINENFIAKGMDGELILDKNILPLNYWNKKILKEKKIFDTQKGIVRNINVKFLGREIIDINNIKINTDKYTLNASRNKKDKGPFPQYTLWYSKNGELIKSMFVNWKDNKKIITQRNDWDKN